MIKACRDCFLIDATKTQKEIQQQPQFATETSNRTRAQLAFFNRRFKRLRSRTVNDSRSSVAFPENLITPSLRAGSSLMDTRGSFGLGAFSMVYFSGSTNCMMDSFEEPELESAVITGAVIAIFSPSAFSLCAATARGLIRTRFGR